MGSHYEWICFDGTPSKPPWNDYDSPPPLQSQWRFMMRAAGGHRQEDRIVFNVGSELIQPLYRDFEFEQRLLVNNDCGGDQRYNLQGRFEKPELWNLAGHRIQVVNPCSIDVQGVVGSGDQATVSWQLVGPWDRVPDATLSIVLQQLDPSSGRARDLATLANNVPAQQGKATIQLGTHSGPGLRLRLLLRRDGDPLTGGVSAVLDSK